MKIVSINSVVNGSTGGVMLGVANAVRAAGGQAYTFSEKRRGQAAPAGHRFFGSRAENLLHRTTAALSLVRRRCCGKFKKFSRILFTCTICTGGM